MAEMQSLLAHARARYLISEADKDASDLRASRYRSIISELMGEGDTQPEARPTATITELQAPIEGPSSGSSTGTRAPPPDSRDLNSASHGESESVQNLVGPSSSRSTQQAVSPAHDLPSMTDNQGSRRSQRNLRQRSVPVPSVSAPRPSQDARGSINGTSLAEVFTRADVTPFELTRDEAARANETPGISWEAFSKTFGGHRRGEWPQCDKIPGYKRFLCADITAQPYVPTAPGKPGLVLRIPTTIFTPQDDGHTFHVFSSRGRSIYYQGEYARSHLQVELDWNDLSSDGKNSWIKRMTCSSQYMAVLHALKARIILRNKFKREPSSTEIHEYLMSDSNDDVGHKVVAAAFRAGEEKMVYGVIQCIGYDANLATIIQRNAR